MTIAGPQALITQRAPHRPSAASLHRRPERSTSATPAPISSPGCRRRSGGRVVLRIEDIDSPRIKPGAAEQALADLRWLGLDWDGEALVQTQRLTFYEEALRRLQERELVYPCTCTRSDIERAASAPHADHEGPIYPGTCAGRSAADAARLGDRPFAWRFRVDHSPSFVDLFRGPTHIDLRQTAAISSSGSPPACRRISWRSS